MTQHRVLSTETQRSESQSFVSWPLCVSAPLIIRLHNLQLRSISPLLLLSVFCHHYQQWQIGLISPSLPLSLKLNHKLAAGLHRWLSLPLMEVNWTRPFGYKLVVIVPGCRAAVYRKMGSDSPCSCGLVSVKGIPVEGTFVGRFLFPCMSYMLRPISAGSIRPNLHAAYRLQWQKIAHLLLYTWSWTDIVSAAAQVVISGPP